MGNHIIMCVPLYGYLYIFFLVVCWDNLTINESWFDLICCPIVIPYNHICGTLRFLLGDHTIMCVTFQSYLWNSIVISCETIQSCVTFQSRVLHSVVVSCETIQSCVTFQSRVLHSVVGSCETIQSCVLHSMYLCPTILHTLDTIWPKQSKMEVYNPFRKSCILTIR